MIFSTPKSLFLILITASVACARPAPTQTEIETTPIAAVSPTAECEEFHALVLRTYDFKPTKLSDAQQTAKSNEMDKVWEKVKADPNKLLPCLKAELRSPDANKFFLFDGSTLLVSVDNSEEAKRALIDGFARTDLEDIVLQNWIAPILKYGVAGLDTSAAGEAWLLAKDPKYYLPQHGTLPVDRRLGALAIYGSMDEALATPALLKIANSKGHPGRDIAVDILSKQATEQSIAGLKTIDPSGLAAPSKALIDSGIILNSKIKPREGAPKISREEYLGAFDKMAKGDSSAFMQLVSRAEDGERDAVVVLKKEDLPKVRVARRLFASTGTPHLKEWYDTFTDIIFFVLKKN